MNLQFFQNKYLPFIFAFFGGIILFFRFLPEGGTLGHDYSHYFARILIGADHFWKNGIRVPHFTPYLCGGIPFHADPQQIYYSLPQFLAFFLEILPSTYLSFLVFYSLGYWGTFKLSRDVFNLDGSITHFVSLLFLLNGFTYNHLLVGHITHMPFLLAPWLIYFLIKKRIVLYSLIVLYCIYSGALHILVVFGLLTLLFLPLVELKKMLPFLIAVPVLVFLGSSGKLLGSLRYSEYFFMHTIDNSGEGLYTLITRYLWTNPFTTVPQKMFGGWSYGAWEYTAPISKLTIILGILGVFSNLRSFKSKAIPILCIFLISLFILILSAGTGLNQSVPFFSHYHNPLKILAVFILPIILLSGIGLQAVQSEMKIPFLAFILLSISVLVEFFISSEYMKRVPHALGYQYPGAELASIREKGGLPPVQKVIAGGIDDYSAMKLGVSSLSCYEPLFGYRRENLKSVIKPESNDLNNPSCLLYSKELNCKPWEVLDNNKNKENFKKGFSVTEWVPDWQKVNDWINAIVVFGMLIYLMKNLRKTKLLAFFLIGFLWPQILPAPDDVTQRVDFESQYEVERVSPVVLQNHMRTIESESKRLFRLPKYRTMRNDIGSGVFDVLQGVEKITEDTLKIAKVDFVDGKLYAWSGVLNTTEKLTRNLENNPITRWMYVMDQRGNIYVHPEKRTKWHHSSFGIKPAAAGMLMVRDGKLIAIDASSGHYLPDAKQFSQVLVGLQRMGVPLEGVELTYFDHQLKKKVQTRFGGAFTEHRLSNPPGCVQNLRRTGK